METEDPAAPPEQQHDEAPKPAAQPEQQQGEPKKDESEPPPAKPQPQQEETPQESPKAGEKAAPQKLPPEEENISHYEALGIDSKATLVQIKKAARAFALSSQAVPRRWR